MKKLQLSVFFLFLLNLSFSFASLKSTYSVLEINRSFNLKESLENDNLIVDDTLPKSTKIIVCQFLSTIDQLTASKMDEFIKKRSGVISSSTDIVSKKITVTINTELLNGDLTFLFDSVKVKFLSELDKPVVKQH